MMKNEDWIVLFTARPWREQYSTLERELRAFLANLPADKTFKTPELAAELFGPLDQKVSMVAVGRLVKLAKNIPGLSHRVPTQMYGQTVHRNVWRHLPIGAASRPAPPSEGAATEGTSIMAQLADLTARVERLEARSII
jgi:hypothetical protein